MIETLQDWNTRLDYCGCCPMPECPTPVIVSEVKVGDAAPNTLIFPFLQPVGDPDELVPTLYDDTDISALFSINGTFQRLSRSDFGGGFTREVFSEVTYDDWGLPTGSATGTRYEYNHDANTGDCTTTTSPLTPVTYGLPRTPIACPLATSSPTRATRYSDCTENLIGVRLTPQTCPGPFPFMAEVAYSNRTRWRVSQIDLIDPVLPQDLIDEAVAESAVDTWTTGAASSSLSLTWPLISDHAWPAVANGDSPTFSTFVASSSTQRTRFRFRIPTSHAGSKFYITYDIAEFREDGDPSFVSEDNVAEWTGPGTGSSSDPSWLTPWVEIDPPEVPGERRIVNIRYTCYSGTKYGSKPQVMGEVLEIPPS